MGDRGVYLHFSGCTGRYTRFFVKKLIKQLLIPPAAINRANNPVFGLWQKVRSFVASARCSTLEGGGAGWLKGGCPQIGRHSWSPPAPLCLPCYAFEHPAVEASVHSHGHALLRKEGKKHHQLHFMVEEIGIQKCSGICPGGILLITLLSTLASEPRSCIFCPPQAVSPVLQKLCSWNTWVLAVIFPPRGCMWPSPAITNRETQHSLPLSSLCYRVLSYSYFALFI